MKVILQKNVLDLGDLGDIKEVSPGYARNYLFPRKLAVSAHASTIRALKHQKRSLENKDRKRKQAMETLAKKLEELGTLEIAARVGRNNKLFGSVTTVAVCEALAKKGFEMSRRKIEFRESIRSLGAYHLGIKLREGFHVNLELKVVPDAFSLKKIKEREKKEAGARKNTATKEKTKSEALKTGKEAEPVKDKSKEKDSSAENAKSKSLTSSGKKDTSKDGKE